MSKLYIMCGLAFSGKSTLAIKIAAHTGSEIVAFDKLWMEEEKVKAVPKNAAASAKASACKPTRKVALLCPSKLSEVGWVPFHGCQLKSASI